MAKQTAVQGNKGTTAPAAEAPAAGPKKACPITRAQFNDNAKPMKMTLEYDGKTVTFVATPRQFDSGSMGFNFNDKAVFDIDSVPVPFQVGCNATIVKSKELPPLKAE